MSQKTAWSIIRDALKAAQRVERGAGSFEHDSARLDEIAREADDAIQALAVAASGSPPSPVDWREDKDVERLGIDVLDHAVMGDHARGHEWRVKLRNLLEQFGSGVARASSGSTGRLEDANFLRGLPLAKGCAPEVQVELDSVADRVEGSGSTGAPTEEAVNHAVNVLDSYAAIRHSFSVESRRRMAREVLLAALPSGPLAQPTPPAS